MVPKSIGFITTITGECIEPICTCLCARRKRALVLYRMRLDQVGTDLHYHSPSHQTTALCAFRHTGQDTQEGLRRSLICRKALLQAGADPTIAHDESGIRSALWESQHGNVDCCASRVCCHPKWLLHPADVARQSLVFFYAKEAYLSIHPA